MRELKNIVKIYDDLIKNKESKKVLNDLNDKELVLFDGLFNDIPEYSISKKLYQASPSHQSFQSLKKGLLEKLLSASFFINTGNSFQINKMKILRRVMTVKIFDLFGQRKIMVSLAKKTLSKCLKYDFYYESIDLARLLSSHYLLYENNPVLSKRYNDIKETSLRIYRKELIAEREHAKVVGKFGTKEFNSSPLELKRAADKIGTLLENRSSRTHLYYYAVKYVQYVAENDLEGRVSICREAIDYFNSRDYRHDLSKSLFFIYLINTYLEQGHLAKAELIINSFLDETDTRSYQYYRFKELLFRVYLFQGKKEKVNELFEYLKNNLKKMENVFSKDRLLIYSIYKSFLNEESINFRKINYNINRVKQDKKGLHIPLLIGQACYYFIHQPDALFDKIESLEQYSYRYLTEDKHKRTKEFIKLLVKGLMNKDVAMDEISELKSSVSSNSLEMIQYEILLNLTFSQATNKQEKIFAKTTML